LHGILTDVKIIPHDHGKEAEYDKVNTIIIKLDAKGCDTLQTLSQHSACPVEKNLQFLQQMKSISATQKGPIDIKLLREERFSLQDRLNLLEYMMPKNTETMRCLCR